MQTSVTLTTKSRIQGTNRHCANLAVHTKMTDPEVLEWSFPLRVDKFAIRHGSGGAGKQPGGNGIVRQVTFLEDMTMTPLTSHRHTDPYGSAGGEAGARGRNIVLHSGGGRE